MVALNFMITVVAAMQSANSYVVEYSSRKWITAGYMGLCFLALFLLWAGVFFGRNGELRKRTVQVKRDLEAGRVLRAFWVVTMACLLAYAIWYVRFISLHGIGGFLSAFNADELSRNMYVYRSNSGSIPGVTSFTEFGVVSAILGAYCLNSDDLDRKRARNVIAVLFVVLVFAYIRARLNSERLAVIELLVTFAVAWMGTSKKPITAVDRWLPLAAVAALVMVFGAFEYSRSWLTHYINYYDSFWDFITMRLFGYYTNASNTEAMYVANGVTSIVPYWSIQWFWQMPGMDAVYSAVAPVDVPLVYGTLLSVLANPEFNNPGGVLTFYKDFWAFGFPLYFLLGYLVGKAYGKFRRGELVGLALYPVFFLMLAELPRYFYLGVNRGFVVMIGLFLFWLIAVYQRNEQHVRVRLSSNVDSFMCDDYREKSTLHK